MVSSLYHLSVFQPALPMRGVTVFAHMRPNPHAISTRTPHAGSDILGDSTKAELSNFNPHSPCGE